MKLTALQPALAVALWLLATPTFAATSWVAQMEEDEGGPVMVASISADGDGGGRPAMLRVMCGGDGQLDIRYDLGASEGELSGQPGNSEDFVFENEQSKETRTMNYEDMDGAFAVYVAKNDALVTLLQNGSDVFISASVGNYATQSFSLRGSTKAIAKVLGSCG